MSNRDLENFDTFDTKNTPKTRKRKERRGMEEERPSKIVKKQPSQMRPFTRLDEEKMLNYLIRTNSIPDGMNVDTWRNLEFDGVLCPHRMGPMFMHFVMKMVPNYMNYKVPERAYHQLRKLFLIREGFSGESSKPGELPTHLTQGTAKPPPPKRPLAHEKRLEAQPIPPVAEENSSDSGRNSPAADERLSNEENPLPQLETSIKRKPSNSTPAASPRNIKSEPLTPAASPRNIKSEPLTPAASPRNIKSEPLTPAATSSDEIIPETPEELQKNSRREIIIPDLSRLAGIKSEKSVRNSGDSLEGPEDASGELDSSPPKVDSRSPRRDRRLIVSSPDNEESSAFARTPESPGNTLATGKSSRDSPITVDSSSSEGSPVLREKSKGKSSRLTRIPVDETPESSSELDSLEADSSGPVPRTSRGRVPPGKSSTAGQERKNPSSGELEGRNPRNESSENSESDGEELGAKAGRRPGASTSRGAGGKGRRRLGPVCADIGVGLSEDEDEDEEPRKKKSKRTTPASNARGGQGKPLKTTRSRQPTPRFTFTAEEDQAMIDALVAHDLIDRATGLTAWQELLEIGIDEIAHRSAKSLRNHFSNYLRWNYDQFTDDPDVRKEFAEAERRREHRQIQRQ